MVGRKAISAMIATVLLIAFTVAVGGILSMWLTSLTSTQTTTTGAAAEKQILCSRSVLTISEVRYSGPAALNVTVVYTYGTEQLSNYTFYVVDDARNSAASLQPAQTMNPGDSNTTFVTTSLAGTGLTSVRVRALCQGSYAVIGECKSGQSCMVKV
jgi:flagellin-like protein